MIKSLQLKIIIYCLVSSFCLYHQVIRGVGLQTRLIISELLPYTMYMIRLQACLRNVLNGCGTSSAVNATTDEDVPASLSPPTLLAVSPTAVQVSWLPPRLPNGQITQYRIYQRTLGDPSSEILINQISGEDLSFIHAGQDLRPYRQYEYQVRFIQQAFGICAIIHSIQSNFTKFLKNSFLVWKSQFLLLRKLTLCA